MKPALPELVLSLFWITADGQHHETRTTQPNVADCMQRVEKWMDETRYKGYLTQAGQCLDQADQPDGGI